MARLASRKEKPTASRLTRLWRAWTGQTAEEPDWQIRHVLNLLLLLAFGGAIIGVCFVGLAPPSPQVSLDKEARIRLVAEFSFTYTSNILTNRLKEERRQTIPRVYRIDLESAQKFAGQIRRLYAQLSEYAGDTSGPRNDPAPPRFTGAEIGNFLARANVDLPDGLDFEDLAILLNEIPAEQRSGLVEESIRQFLDVVRRGIYDPTVPEFAATRDRLSFFNLAGGGGEKRLTANDLQSEEDALRELRINLTALPVSRDASLAIFRILKGGLHANLLFDHERTASAVQAAVEQVAPVSVQVREGDAIIQPGMRVGPLQSEQLDAYRAMLRERLGSGWGVNPLLLEQSILTFIILLGMAMILREQSVGLTTRSRWLGLIALAILFDLGLIRLVLEMAGGAVGRNNPLLQAMLPWMTPVAMGPILVALLAGVRPALLVAFMVSLMAALMEGNSLAVFILSNLASLVGVVAVHGVRVRARVVRAGLLAGGCVALAALGLGIRDGLEMEVILAQMAAALGVGGVTGVLALGLLPVLESLFKYTTDITLLELTDFNHPLLRRMQEEAPGSYHHSLMVANLAENAAAGIGANPLLCRICALFHDIGKLVKPEYFSENQREGNNPHLDRNPSMSALIIKAHVKEGVALALQNRLPEVCVDVIRQHHGTSLIQYFYVKAIEQRQRDTPPVFGQEPKAELDPVSENIYRYEGPKPQFRESAIVMLADSVEAASRSLRKATPQSIDELIEKIFTARLEDGQLDESPITFNELLKVKKSFSRSLLNMLHARVEYPAGPAPQAGPA